jgi:hypothetical protein
MGTHSRKQHLPQSPDSLPTPTTPQKNLKEKSFTLLENQVSIKILVSLALFIISFLSEEGMIENSTFAVISSGNTSWDMFLIAQNLMQFLHKDIKKHTFLESPPDNDLVTSTFGIWLTCLL